MSERGAGQAIPLGAQIACAARELRLRKRVYPGWVAQGRLKPEEAEYEIAAMEAIHQTLEQLAGGGQRELMW